MAAEQSVTPPVANPEYDAALNTRLFLSWREPSTAKSAESGRLTAPFPIAAAMVGTTDDGPVALLVCVTRYGELLICIPNVQSITCTAGVAMMRSLTSKFN